MLSVHYIGDETGSRGMALAGAKAHIPAREREAVVRALARARLEADLVVIESGLAELVREELAGLLQHEVLPPVVVLPPDPDVTGIRAEPVSVKTTIESARAAIGMTS